MAVLYYVVFVCAQSSREHSIDKIIKHKHSSLTSYKKVIYHQNEAPQKVLRPRH